MDLSHRHRALRRSAHHARRLAAPCDRTRVDAARVRVHRRSVSARISRTRRVVRHPLLRRHRRRRNVLRADAALHARRAARGPRRRLARDRADRDQQPARYRRRSSRQQAHPRCALWRNIRARRSRRLRARAVRVGLFDRMAAAHRAAARAARHRVCAAQSRTRTESLPGDVRRDAVGVRYPVRHRMQFWIWRYTLKPRRRLSAVAFPGARHGALLRAYDGYADIHPWSELGDAPLDEQLARLARGETTPLTRASLHHAQVDGRARTYGVSLFAGLTIPESHWPGDNPPPAFDTVKLKGVSSIPPRVRLRIDFNATLTPDEFVRVADILPHDRIDFIEDPVPYDETTWLELRQRTNSS